MKHKKKKQITTGDLKISNANERLPAAILNYLRTLTPRFLISREAAKVYDSPARDGMEAGWLKYDFFLSDLKACADHGHKIDDASILKTLDALTAEKVLCILEINYLDNKLEDMQFKAILAAGIREKHFPYDFPVLQSVVWLNKNIDYPSEHIEFPTKVFNSMAANRTAKIKGVDLELEAQLHREELRELAEFKRRLTSETTENEL